MTAGQLVSVDSVINSKAESWLMYVQRHVEEIKFRFEICHHLANTKAAFPSTGERKGGWSSETSHFPVLVVVRRKSRFKFEEKAKNLRKSEQCYQ